MPEQRDVHAYIDANRDRFMTELLEFLRIPYTHSGVLASALAMQKDRAKVIMKAAGVSSWPHEPPHMVGCDLSPTGTSVLRLP